MISIKGNAGRGEPRRAIDGAPIEPITAEEIAAHERKAWCDLLSDQAQVIRDQGAEIKTRDERIRELEADRWRWCAIVERLQTTAPPVVWLALKIAAGRLGVEEETCRVWADDGVIVAEKRGNGRGRWYVRFDSLEAHVTALRGGPPTLVVLDQGTRRKVLAPVP
jgi:hypothetical protein